MSRELSALAVAVAFAAGLGCTAPEHLTPGYGESYRTALARQAIRAPGESAEPVTGLDSQEAAIISSGYLESLASKGEVSTDEEQSLLYVAPRPQGAAAQRPLPPPSVPQEQK